MDQLYHGMARRAHSAVVADVLHFASLNTVSTPAMGIIKFSTFGVGEFFRLCHSS